MKKLLLVVLASAFALGGCSGENTKTLIGGAVGAIGGGLAGGAIGNRTGNKKEGAIIGAVVGSVAGALIGKRLDQQAQELKTVPGMENVTYDQQAQTIETRMSVLFDTDKSDIKYSERTKLDELANVFAKYPENIVNIEGHTDNVGTDAYNMELSKRRAASIESYLRSKNLNISRLSSAGYGESMPIADNSTSSGREQNRRVEIKISVDPSRVPQQTQPGT